MAYKGKAHSTSNYGGFFEENAFRPGIQTEPNPRPGWSSAGVFPQIVWFQFEEQKTLTKIGFSTRSNEPTVSQAPKRFEVVASVDCNQFQSNAEVLLSIEDAGFEKMNRDIPRVVDTSFSDYSTYEDGLRCCRSGSLLWPMMDGQYLAIGRCTEH